MDIMDIQAVESKLSDVTVTPIPRNQVQNFYNYQQQREQREQQPQIQISAIHHPPRGERDRDRDHHHHHHHHNSGGSGSGSTSGSRSDLYAKQSSSSAAAAMAAATALQYTQQIQAQLALLQQQSSAVAAAAVAVAANNATRGVNGGGGSSSSTSTASPQSQIKYTHPAQSGSPPMVVTTQTSANITTPMTSTAGLPTAASAANGLTKYAQLLAVIEEMGRDIRPTYTGSRSSTERFKRGIVAARILVRDCLMETERSARQ